jgi:hypothetical protein
LVERTFDTHSRSEAGPWLLLLFFGFLSLPVYAVKPETEVLPAAEAELPESRPISYANATNEQLDALGARWGYLSAPERRALLAEVRRRMAQNTENTGRVRIQTTRQFGVVQRPDGTTIRVERRIIRMIPANQGPGEQQGYGTGFEQRAARDPSTLPSTPQEAERRALEQEAERSLGPSRPLPGAAVSSDGMLPASAPLDSGPLLSPEQSR